MDGSSQQDEQRERYQSSLMNKSYGVHEYAKGDTLTQCIVPNEYLQGGEQEEERPRQDELELLECPYKEIDFEAGRQQEYRAIMELHVMDELTDGCKPILHLREELRVGQEGLVSEVVITHIISKPDHQREYADNHICVGPLVRHGILIRQEHQGGQQQIIDVICEKHINLSIKI